MRPVKFKTTFHIAFSALMVPYLMMLIAAILAILAILSGCSSDSDPNTPSAVNYTEQGWRLYKSGNYAQALLSFERATNFDENLADAHNGIGWSHLSLSLNPPLAQEAFQNAVQLDASNADAWVGLANILYLRNKGANDFRSAIRAIDNALQGDVQYLFRHDYRSKADLYALKASCYFYLGEHQSVEVEINKALQIDTTNGTAIALQNLLAE
ncbi:hypothetical protein C6503_18225 [Candidatus Poribacteria bacterium]|nr:MAG: hypothetical protein C6503_18225 [Candidatus Poribacteria bacterium]